MATIRKHTSKDGIVSFRVQIRSNNVYESKTFNDEQSAILYGWYREYMEENISAFSVPDAEKYTIGEVMYLKYKDDNEYGYNSVYFEAIKNTTLKDATYEMLMNHAQHLLKVPILRGGCVKMGKGRLKLPSVITILRKYAYLSAAINELISKGLNLPNEAIKIVAYLRELSKQDNLEKEDLAC